MVAKFKFQTNILNYLLLHNFYGLLVKCIYLLSESLCWFQGGLTATDVFAVEWIQTGVIHFGMTVSYFGFVSDGKSWSLELPFFFLYLNLYCGQLISHQAYITSSKHSEIEHIHNLVLQVPAFCFFVFLDHLYLNFLVPWCLLSSEVWRRNALSPCFWSFRLVSVSNTWCLPYIIVRHLPYKWFISLLILLKKELVNTFCG